MKLQTSRADKKRLKVKKAQQAYLASWKPKASELQLPDVPASEREAVRQRLEPVLNGLKTVESYFLGPENEPVVVRGGDCMATAQAVVLNAMDAGIQYVEGAWENIKTKHRATASIHAWVTVDGHIVDLTQEFYTRRDGELYAVEREPLQSFSYAELEEMLEDFGMWENISMLKWEQANWESLPVAFKENIPYDPRPDGTYGTDEQRAKFEEQQEKRTDFVIDSAFKPAIEKLNARLLAEGKALAPVVVPDGMQMMFYAPEHNEGDPICILHSAFDDVGFCVHKCDCCDSVGYAAGPDVPFLGVVSMLKAVMTKIKGVSELREDYNALADEVETTMRERHGYRYDPKAFKFEIRFEPKALQPQLVN